MTETKRVGSVRERLLHAADDLFYREGVHTVGIDRILEQAGVAKASLYGTFKSKDELVRAYLEGRSQRLHARIESKMAGVDGARERILAVFDGLAGRVAEGAYYGCPFVRACAEAPPAPNAARDVAAAHRAWLRDLFERLAREAGVRDAEGMSRQLSLLHDGAAVAVSMDNEPAAALAARRIAERLLEPVVTKARTRSKSGKSSSRRKTGAK